MNTENKVKIYKYLWWVKVLNETYNFMYIRISNEKKTISLGNVDESFQTEILNNVLKKILLVPAQ